jgi:hypothetical protein
MKRWSGKKQKHIEVPAIDSFIEEVIEVCKKHGFSISHEDCRWIYERLNKDK